MMRFLSEHFQLRERGTTPRIEVVAGTTTFLTMAYVIFVQPAVLSGSLFGTDTGMDFGAVTTATCLAAALATAIMGLYARYPIALAPGMGQNFFFVFTAIPVAAAAGSPDPWRAALGAVFIAGVAFLIVSVLGIRERIIDAVSPSLKHAIAVGIGVFVAFIGLRNAQVIVADPGTAVRLNARFLSPDIVVFVVGFLVAAALHARRIAGSIVWGIAAGLVTALILRAVLPLLPVATTTDLVRDSRLWTQFAPAQDYRVAAPLVGSDALPNGSRLGRRRLHDSNRRDFLLHGRIRHGGYPDRLGAARGHVSRKQTAACPAGDDVGCCRDGRGRLARHQHSDELHRERFRYRAGRENRTNGASRGHLVPPRPSSSIQSYRWLAATPPITTPALVLVGAMMARNVTQIQWADYTESIPAFLVIIGIPLSFSIADGLSLGLISYPLVKLLSGRAPEVNRSTWVLAVILALYFAFVRSRL